MISRKVIAVAASCFLVLPLAATAGQKSARSINVVFAYDPGAGNYDGAVGKPSDSWNLVDVGVTKLSGLKSRKGQKTSVELRVSENDGEWGIEGNKGIFHGYIYHNNRCVDLDATFTGLPAGRYRIYVYAHGDAPDQNAEIELAVGKEVYGRKATLNDGSWKFRSSKLAEGVQYVSFEFTATSKDPVRITSFRSGSTYSMFNAIQIVPLGK